jgi:hypothetical protein
VHPAVFFSDNDYQLRPRLLRVRVLFTSGGQITGITFVYQAAKKRPKGCRVESGSVYLGSTSVRGAAH